MFSPSTIDAQWRAWLDENRARGCDPAELFRIMLEKGLAFDVAMTTFVAAFGAGATNRPAPAPSVEAHRFSAFGVEELCNDKAEAYYWPDFLGPDECAAVVAAFDYGTAPSTVLGDSYGETFRTSRTAHFPSDGDPVVAAVNDKICFALGIGRAFGEPIQGQSYEPGQYFKAHTDYFDAGHWDAALRVQGQRTWTFMIYLNDTPAGGETVFPRLGLSIAPKRGAGLFWNNLNAEGAPNPFTLHEATPVEEGEKYVITKWFRERPLGGRQGGG